MDQKRLKLENLEKKLFDKNEAFKKIRTELRNVQRKLSTKVNYFFVPSFFFSENTMENGAGTVICF